MSDEKKKRKKKRSAEELLAAKKRELAKLEARVKRKKIEEAIESGSLSDEKEKEFKGLKRRASVMKKAADIFEDAGEDEAVDIAHKLETRFNKAIAALIQEAEEEVSDEEEEDEEYEEDDDEYEDDDE